MCLGSYVFFFERYWSAMYQLYFVFIRKVIQLLS
jgi:hypothetical protein